MKPFWAAFIVGSAILLLAAALPARSDNANPFGDDSRKWANTPATQPAADMQALLKGRKVLVAFQHYPMIEKLAGHPTDEARAAARTQFREKILQSLKDARIEVVKMTAESQDETLTYNSLLLLDCQGQDPVAALKNVPYVLAGIVFQDGAYQKAIPAENPTVPMVRKGQVPAAHAFNLWGYGENARKVSDMERYKTLDNVEFTYIEPPLGSGGSSGSMKMTPKEGHTLLEVFLLTGAGFEFEDAPATQPATATRPAG